MNQRKHKVESEDKSKKASRAKESNPQVVHPLLQLQQTIGNKAVTNLVQRHPEQDSRIESVTQAHNKLWGDHLLTSQSVKFAHERTKDNKSSISVLWGKVNQLSQSSGGGSGSGDIYED